MPDTEWFNRQPGDAYIKPVDESQPLAEQMIIIGAGPPDWVRLPPELGALFGEQYVGLQVRVTKAFHARCPKCQAPCKVLELAEPIPENEHLPRLHASECVECKQFCFYRTTYTHPAPPVS